MEIVAIIAGATLIVASMAAMFVVAAVVATPR